MQVSINRSIIAIHLFSDPVCQGLYSAWCHEQGYSGTVSVEDAKSWIVSKGVPKERAEVVLFFSQSSAELV